MTGAAVSWERVRTLGDKLTTPLHPDDYLSLVNPLWSSRELRGRIEKVIPETEDAATLVIRPGWGWKYDHSPGQYVGIGVQVEGKFQWRSYSVSSPPKRSRRTIEITVRAMPEGKMSGHLVKGLTPGTIVRLAKPEGDFILPDPPPAQMLFLVGGSGITPVMAMLRTMDRRNNLSDVVVHYSSTTPERMIFRDELLDLDEKWSSLTFHEHHSDADGIFGLEGLDTLCPDWRERETWACGPGPMLDAAEQHWAEQDRADRLHLERFSLALTGEAGEGGSLTFRNSNKTVEADGATTILEAGEQAGVGMPFGCRMGICHTCTVTKVSGTIRDLRNGEEYNQPNEQVQTCVTAAVNDCTFDI
ncbi:ferredoxin reductase [Nocardioides salsibiostraticola]